MKKEIRTITGTKFELDIVPATAAHVQGLTNINHRWQRKLLGNNTDHGFLSAAFSFETFNALVNSEEVVVGLLNGEVISYYIVNSISTDGVLFKHEQIVQGLKERSILPAVSRVGLGAQALVDKDFQGSQ